MTIATEIQRLQGIKTEIMAALERKSVDTTGKNMSDVGDLIRSIQVKPEGAVIGGRTYRTVKIGNQEWLAENLDFKASGIEIAPSGFPGTPAAWYYNNDEATYGVNGNKYGLLYNWYAVKYLNDNRVTLMPGWHVPSTEEWDALANAVGGVSVAGTHLKSTIGWSSGTGSDDFGFSAFPAGKLYTNVKFSSVGDNALFWAATEYSRYNGHYRYLTADASMTNGSYSKDFALSVRLVKDS